MGSEFRNFSYSSSRERSSGKRVLSAACAAAASRETSPLPFSLLAARRPLAPLAQLLAQLAANPLAGLAGRLPRERGGGV